MVTPAISQHFQRHMGAAPDYDMSWETMLKLLGLKDLMQLPSFDCCDRDVHFLVANFQTARMRAKVVWQGHPSTIPSKVVPGLDYSVELTLPSRIEGSTRLGGGFSEFFFCGTLAPHLKVSFKQKTIFDSDIRCFNSTSTFATVLPTDPSSLGILFLPE
jgi:hypothetical protein